MNKKSFMKKLQDIKLVAHRLGYEMTPYPENSFEVIEFIFKNKELLNACHGFEFDICFTKDHIPIVIHDKYIDDITNSNGLIKEYTLSELQEKTFGFRKTKKSNQYYTYKVITLEELLTFFKDNLKSLGNKIIKIETKDYLFINKSNFRTTNLQKLANIINQFPELNKNIVHLSFWPINLLYLKNIQKKYKYKIIKNDLLCDQNFMVTLSKLMKFLDNISLRIKDYNITETSKKYSRRVNRIIKRNQFFMKRSNTIKEKNLQYAIDKFGSIGLYTLNTNNEIDELCKKISDKFIEKNYSKIIITTNNPYKLKQSK